MKELDNEITVKVLCSKKELIQILENTGCKYDTSFRLDDTYYILNFDPSIDSRELLKNAIIERIITDDKSIHKELVYKIKNINSDGTILSQEKYTLKIVNEKEVKDFLNALGYSKTIRLIEDDLIYKYDGVGIVVKDVLDMGLLIEIETRENTDYDTIEKLKELVDYLEIPIMKNEYFIKKAELALSKIIK